MALNFDIVTDKIGDGYRLKLRGEFDATSAYELVYAIKKLADKPVRIYVNTSELKRVHPFGLEVFNRAMRFSGRNSAQVVFRGNQDFSQATTIPEWKITSASHRGDGVEPSSLAEEGYDQPRTKGLNL